MQYIIAFFKDRILVYFASVQIKKNGQSSLENSIT